MWTVHLFSFFLSFFLSLYLFHCLSIYLSVSHPFLSLYLVLSLSASHSPFSFSCFRTMRMVYTTDFGSKKKKGFCFFPLIRWRPPNLLCSCESFFPSLLPRREHSSYTELPAWYRTMWVNVQFFKVILKKAIPPLSRTRLNSLALTEIPHVGCCSIEKRIHSFTKAALSAWSPKLDPVAGYRHCPH